MVFSCGSLILTPWNTILAPVIQRTSPNKLQTIYLAYCVSLYHVSGSCFMGVRIPMESLLKPLRPSIFLSGCTHETTTERLDRFS
jgi:hypothetical protein